MKWLQRVIGVCGSMLVILAILITVFQVAVYGDFSFYEKEYVKYEVTEALDMELEDVMDVTHKMMDYLIGEREELSVVTTIGGQEMDFFNEQDRLHMSDVKNLFLGGLRVRTWSLIGGVLCILFLLLTKADWKRILPDSWLIGMAVYGIAVVVVGIAAARDFTAAFTLFHEIFFTNDLWLFDPNTDYMIRMLPEGFFADMAMRIGSMFAAVMVLITAVCLWIRYRTRKTEKMVN